MGSNDGSPKYWWIRRGRVTENGKTVGRMIGVPIWYAFASLLILTVLIWRRAGRYNPVGHCDKCGYNLTGNVSGFCPECGTKAIAS
jgi:hypothetical protein